MTLVIELNSSPSTDSDLNVGDGLRNGGDCERNVGDCGSNGDNCSHSVGDDDLGVGDLSGEPDLGLPSSNAFSFVFAPFSSFLIPSTESKDLSNNQSAHSNC